jgi:hypothetical protein
MFPRLATLIASVNLHPRLGSTSRSCYYCAILSIVVVASVAAETLLASLNIVHAIFVWTSVVTGQHEAAIGIEFRKIIIEF